MKTHANGDGAVHLDGEPMTAHYGSRDLTEWVTVTTPDGSEFTVYGTPEQIVEFADAIRSAAEPEVRS